MKSQITEHYSIEFHLVFKYVHLTKFFSITDIDVSCPPAIVGKGMLVHANRHTSGNLELTFQCHVMHAFPDGSIKKTFMCEKGVWTTVPIDCEGRSMNLQRQKLFKTLYQYYRKFYYYSYNTRSYEAFLP